MGEKLTAKLGPLPVWAWGVIIGILIVAWQWRSRMSPAPELDAEEAAAVQAASAPYGSFGTVPVVPPPADVIAPEKTNAEWMATALKAIQNNNMGSSLNAQIALEKYLTGKTLTAAESKIVNYAIQVAGIPPQGVQETPSVEPEPEAPKPVQPTHRGYVSVEKNGTIYRVEMDGSLTPFSQATWSSFRQTPEGSGIVVTLLSGQAAANAKRARKNPMI